jgi:flagellar biosynthetic protein FlhB
MMAIAFAVAALQAKATFTFKTLEPKFERINPIANAKNLVSPKQIVELVKSLSKLAIVGFAVWGTLKLAVPEAAALTQQAPLALLDFIRRYAVKLLMGAGLSYLALALADYAWQWWQLEKSLRMSKDELKQEMKESEGDPHVKSRRRQIARSYARRQMLRDVAKADVVITNPTHIAVAIQYDPDAAPAPIVLAMGQRKVAERIRELAAEHGVPIVRNVPVARALFKSARVGTIIPFELYVAVAEILAFVIRTRGTRGSWAGSATA